MLRNSLVSYGFGGREVYEADLELAPYYACCEEKTAQGEAKQDPPISDR